MNTTPRSPRLLLLSTALLAVAGVALLGLPHGHQEPPSPAPSPTVSATTDPSPAARRHPAAGTTVSTAASTTSAVSTPSVLESALPPHGEGVAGDRAIQRSLQAAWPADLPAADERELLTAGRALLCADATGVGRTRWPDVFGDSSQALAPAFATARFRIQAAIARRDGTTNKAVVHLVWAGMDRGGTFTDLRITDWFFTRTIKKGAATWTWPPRT